MIIFAVLIPLGIFVYMLEAYNRAITPPKLDTVWIYQEELYILNHHYQMIGESQAISLMWARENTRWLTETYLPSHGFECLGPL